MYKGITKTFEKIFKNKQYRFWVSLFGCLSLVFVAIRYFSSKSDHKYAKLQAQVKAELDKNKVYETLLAQSVEQVQKKCSFFGKKLAPEKMQAQAAKMARVKFEEQLYNAVKKAADEQGVKEASFTATYAACMEKPLFAIFSFIVSFPMYLLMLIFANPIVKYIFERLVMMIFVVFGVTLMVFTILYFSPMDPAKNILGQTATQEQVDNFNRIYGLDQPYIVRLFSTFKQLATFDLGNTFVGNQSVATEISNKFPVTMQVAFWAVLVSVGIAIPSGIISAIKQYSSFDYIFMFIALIGLSVPNFWMALIMILEFSIKLGWLPATFILGDWKSMIMPAIVLGTGMSASVARMTRSSMLEVKNSDYVLTAKAKGLSSFKVTMKHILGNAMIPIVTVIGLQFGGMLGGSAVTEKSFNINGLGSFIVDRQFVPDIPVVMAGVVYIAVVISVVNLGVDILYAFLDPRIKSKMKNY